MSLTCPRPGPRNPGGDCGLYDHRLVFSSEAQLLQRLILSARQRPSLAALIAAEAGPAAGLPDAVPAQLPTPSPSPTFPTPKVKPDKEAT